MSSQRVHGVTWLKVPLDLALISGSLLLAYALASVDIPVARSHGQPSLHWYVAGVLPAYLAAFLFAGVFFRLYRPRRAGSYGRLLFDLTKVIVQVILLVLALSFYVREFSFSRVILTNFFVLNLLVLFLHHWGWMARERRLYGRGTGTRNALLVGTGELAHVLLERLDRNPWAGLRVVGLVNAGDLRDEEPAPEGIPHSAIPLLGKVGDLTDLALEHKVQEIIVAVPFRQMGVLSSIDKQLTEPPVGLSWVPDLEALDTLHRVVTDFDGLPLIDLRGAPTYGLSGFLKRCVDVVLSFLLLIGLSPILALLALVLRVRQGSPVLFQQERVGLNGKTFPLLKFRTMSLDAETVSGPVFAAPDDPRVTRFGRFLRRSSLDELPQLFNVLVGHMSLVGPRPERPVFIDEFKHTVPRYMLRHRVKAGLTGWAQVNGLRGNTSLPKRIQFDLYYIRNWSLWFDLKILFLTLFRAWGRRWNAY